MPQRHCPRILAVVLSLFLGLIATRAADPAELNGSYVLAETWHENDEQVLTVTYVRLTVTGKTIKLTPLTDDDYLSATGNIADDGQVTLVSTPEPGHRISYQSTYRDGAYLSGTMTDTIDGDTTTGTWVLRPFPTTPAAKD